MNCSMGVLERIFSQSLIPFPGMPPFIYPRDMEDSVSRQLEMQLQTQGHIWREKMI